MQNASYYIILGFVCLIFIYALFKRINAYDAFIRGVTDSMKTGMTILPYLMVMYIAVSVFKASGILEDLLKFQDIPPEFLMQGAFRPISSHASLSMMISIFKAYGPDSKIGMISSILQGGSDTTVYVMGLYFGYIGIKKTRHAYIVGLISDFICFLLCFLLFFLI